MRSTRTSGFLSPSRVSPVARADEPCGRTPVAIGRRSFLSLASGLLVPMPEPVRSYFFAPALGWSGDAETDAELRERVYRKFREMFPFLTPVGQRVADAWFLPALEELATARRAERDGGTV